MYYLLCFWEVEISLPGAETSTSNDYFTISFKEKTFLPIFQKKMATYDEENIVTQCEKNALCFFGKLCAC